MGDWVVTRASRQEGDITARVRPQLLAVAADGTVMELYRYVGGWHLDPTTKVGRGVCSATGCEEAASYMTRRSERWWGMCQGHAQVYAADSAYWTPGMAYPEVSQAEPVFDMMQPAP